MSQGAGGEGTDPKTRKSRGSKATKSQDSKAKQKISVYISMESVRRLGVHATMTGQDKSTVVDTLIREHLRDWVVQYRPSTGKPAEESGADEELAAG
jgi:hypothetical protein